MGWHHGKEELVCWEEFMIRVVSGWRTVIRVNDNILNDPLQMMHKQTRDGPRFMSLGSGHGIGSIWSRSTVQAPLLSDQVGRWRTPKWQDPRQKLATTVFSIHTAFVRKINRSNITETNAVVRFILWIIIVVFWWQGANRSEWESHHFPWRPKFPSSGLWLRLAFWSTSELDGINSAMAALELQWIR